MQLLVYGPGRLGGAIALAAADAGWTTTLVGRPRPTARAPRRSAPTSSSRPPPATRSSTTSPTRSWRATAGSSSPRARGTATLPASGRSSSTTTPPRSSRRTSRWAPPCSSAWPSRPRRCTRGPGSSRRSSSGTGAARPDRPSGTARTIARRITAVDPRWAGPDAPGDPRPALEVVGIRAGVAPGTHLVTFDGPGESRRAAAHRPRPHRLCRRRPRRRPLAGARGPRPGPPPVRRGRGRPPGCARDPASATATAWPL